MFTGKKIYPAAGFVLVESMLVTAKSEIPRTGLFLVNYPGTGKVLVNYRAGNFW